MTDATALSATKITIDPQKEKDLKACSRFLSLATMGHDYGDIVKLYNYRGNSLEQKFRNWVFDEFQRGGVSSVFRKLEERGCLNLRFFGGAAQFDSALVGVCLDQGGLRTRVAFALSQIFVMAPTRSGEFMGAAHFWDTLVSHSFGSFRTLLGKVCRSPSMAKYLTFLNNKKAQEGGGVPDENFARELMQLFTIGLYRLNNDGSLVKLNGKPVETYSQEDIMELAKVFTGWVMDGRVISPDPELGRVGNADAYRRDLVQATAPNQDWYEKGQKSFLRHRPEVGSPKLVIPENTPAQRALELTLDHIFNHPNVPPFIGKQLIQRLVTSNPSPAYVERVSRKFINNGNGVRGDLEAVIMAVLTDPEAITRKPPVDKVREPFLRFTAWARAFSADCKGEGMMGYWNLGNLSDPATRLGQSPMRSPSVFNFFRPGYVPPGTRIAKEGRVAPEFQLVDEVSVAGYINFMQMVIEERWTKEGKRLIKADYERWLPVAHDAQKLFDRVNLVLAAGQIGSLRGARIVEALNSLPATTSAEKIKRIQVATLLVMACPQYIAMV
ncbi:MAG: hypothetical protein RIR70_1237 [Pseudomonadota bacterium]|jgi:uncharacterized protein (DUF1800 family)